MEKKTAQYVAAGTAAVLGLMMGASALVSIRTDYAIAKLSRRANELRQQHEALPTRHDAPWGETVEGKAFEHYERAAELALAWDDITILEATKRSDAELTSSDQRTGWQAVAAEVRRGAHARDRRMVRPFDRPDRVANLLSYRRAVNTTLLEARCQRAEGNELEAIRLTLDAMTFGVDSVCDGILINQMIGAALVAIGCESWREPALSQLEPESLRQFAAGLAKIDARFPAVLRLEHEFTVMAGLLLAVPGQDAWHGGATIGYGFSGPWMTAEAFLMMADLIEPLNKLQQAPWPQRKALLEKQAAKMLASGNRAAHAIMPNLVSAETNLRQTKTGLRLLRTAVDMHLGEKAALLDPLGVGELQVACSDGAVELSSAGSERTPMLRRRIELRRYSTGARTNFTKR